MKRFYFLLFALLLASNTVYAQRFTDHLSRGLVAVPTGSTSGSQTNFVSWRRFAEEYYGVTYNLYRDSALIASGLTKSSYDDNGGTPSVHYQVAAVVNGVEKEKCSPVQPWSEYVYRLDDNRFPTGFLDIPLVAVYDRKGNDVTEHYEPNDAELADLDGDGDLEIIIKRLNTVDAANVYPISNTTEFVVLDAYDINWQTGEAALLWRIDCGPNMVSLNSTEINLIAYDWDEDGKAEVVLRGANNMMVYGKDGKEVLYTIGDMNVNTRNTFDPANGAQYAWTHTGAEYLIYMNGETGELYQKMDYPLLRLEYASSLSKEWGGEGYGHNSSKYFFGAPVLDGRNASLFMARGIYGTHKMIAMDLDRNTHQWSQRWRWNCTNSGSLWYGNGYHNFVVADVDEDGRDEIVYGSMVIDDTGKGLSTSGLGHGDAQHVGDFDPYRKGLEFFGCLEGATGMNYRNATTSKIYLRSTSGGDDGRALIDNFSNAYPGSLGRSVSSGIFSSVTDKFIEELGGNTYIAWGDLNFRIYWDGDLCSEILNSPGVAREAKIEKPGVGRLFTSEGCNMNNDSKNNPCFQGDIIGDWREEIIVRCGGNLRVYTTGTSTEHDVYTLWHDHQYRQAMVWQMMAYNQPPHLSFFLGEMENITVAPPPLTLAGRTSLGNGASITTANNGQHLLLDGYANMTVNVEEGAQPQILTVNTPAWVKGNDNNNISTTTYHHTIGGAALTGDLRLVKQGWGQLILSKQEHSYAGPTEVWQGALSFDGTLSNSALWLNRMTTLNSSEGTFNTVKADYGATINIGGATENVSSVNIGTLNLGFGSKVVFDVNGDGAEDNDQLNVGVLNVEKKTDEAWVNYGPEYLAPRFWFNCTTASATVFPLGQIGELAEGCSLDDIILEGVDEAREPQLMIEDGVLYLKMKEANPTVAPELKVIDMVQTETDEYPAEDGPYYMPKVGLRAQSDQTTLSGYFTDADGNITHLEPDMFETLRYLQDYESSTDASGWTCNLTIALNYDEAHGNYIDLAQGGGSGSRYAYTSFTSRLDDVYCAEFDVAFHPAQGNYVNNSLLLYGGNVPNLKNSWWEWHQDENNDYVFRINGGANKGTTYTVEGDNNSFVLNDNSWYHFKVTVNQTKREVSYTVYSGSATLASGNYTISDSNIQMGIHGMFINLGRNNSNAKVDNIMISNGDEPAFTFTCPGTLYLTASEEGLTDNTVSMTVERPYVIRYDSPDFSSIKAADAASTLGADLWSEETTTGRWAYWATGEYTFANAFLQDKMYVDSGKILWANKKVGHPSNRPLQLVEGYGLGQNSGATTDADFNEGTVFHAAGLGDDKTIIYHRYDFSRGAPTKNYLSEYLNADENGNYDYDCGGNFTLQKFTAYIPYEGIVLGDANGDGSVSVADVMLTVRYVANGGAEGFFFRNADVNFDADITVSDIMGIVRILID